MLRAAASNGVALFFPRSIAAVGDRTPFQLCGAMF
jgi:hypothetical protein